MYIALGILITIILIMRLIDYNFMNKIPRGMTLYFANKGSGKTTMLAFYAYIATHNKKYVKRYPNGVFSNVPIMFTQSFTVNDMKDTNGNLTKGHLGHSKYMENCLVLLDEGAIELPNTKQLPEDIKTYFRLSRHYNADIIFCSQSWEDLNVVIRRLYDNCRIMTKGIGKHTTKVRPISKKIVMTEESREPVDQYNYIYPWFISFKFRRRPWYKYFDSWDRPELEDMTHFTYSIINPPTKFEKFLKKVALIWETLGASISLRHKEEPRIHVVKERN